MPSGSGDEATGPALDLRRLSRAYASGELTPSDVIAAIRARIDARGKDAVWISLTPVDALAQAARRVEARQRAGEALPLFGVPFAVKDNIDVAGLPTTAACPAFAYTPRVSAPVVARLVDAGAIVVGKTNLDQFATGLVGVRSPYGIPRNPFHADFITGGSSSGSAAAVALGEVSFALGTDTAGSGRIPAAFNNIVGLKPSRGVLSATGVVPACRSLDCVSVFALTCEDAALVAEAARAFDPTDPFSRTNAGDVAFRPEVPAAAAALPSSFTFGVPAARHLVFDGDAHAAGAFESAVAAWTRLGGTAVEVDMQPFFEAGALLYEGPFVVERLEATGALFASDPNALVSPLRAILQGATRHDARAVFAAQARLQTLSRQVARQWMFMNFLLLPTAPTIPTVAAVQAEPLRANSALGIYTTFANLLDLAALAVPGPFRDDGLPAGVTLLGPWGSDSQLGGFGARFQEAVSSRLGATSWTMPPAPSTPNTGAAAIDGEDAISIAVVGAHLSGEPLNHQLTSIGGRLLRACSTAPRYRLFALPDTTPSKPGLLHVADHDDDNDNDVRDPARVEASARTGVSIALEVWSLPRAAFGTFVSRIPAPLCIGKIELDDGSVVSGFLCEAHAVTRARDISDFGGWRAYLRQVR